MLPRHTNLVIGGLLLLAFGTGLVANTVDRGWVVHPAVLHGVAALGIVVVAPWKAVVVRRGFTRPRTERARSGRWWSVGLLATLVVALGSGLLHATGLTARLGPLTVMQVHIGAAVLAVALVVVHWRIHPIRPRRQDGSRRTLLRVGALGLAAVVTRTVWEAGLSLTDAPGAVRRDTGSHERGSFDPAAMPVTSWLDDPVPDIDPTTWVVDVAGRALGSADLDAMAQDTVEAVLDCTSGWYATQHWRGARLDMLLGDAIGDSPSIEVTSATGYSRILPARDLDVLWLCTQAGDQPLSAGHGAPARLVAPGRRGFWWVKWVVAIRPSQRPWWAQPPYPLT